MKQYVHGGDIYSARERLQGPILDFSANINPLGLPQGVKEAIIQSLDQCHHYPDPFCRELVQGIRTKEQVESKYIICGNGAADLIFRFVQAKRPQKAMVLAPTFAEYEQALQSIGCQVVYYDLAQEQQFQVDKGLLEQLDDSLDILFICNPNNPTGQIIPVEQLVTIMERCKELNLTLVVDECFNDFLDEPERYTVKGYLEGNDHLFILKAFTKFYAMAGLRLGYGLCSDSTVLEQMEQCGQPWSVSTVAQAAGIQALQEVEYQRQTKDLIKAQRQRLIAGLGQQGMTVIGSYANYIFFYAEQGIKLKEQLEKYGILIRSCANYRGLDEHYFRIAVKSPKDNGVLLEALQQIGQGAMNHG